MDETNIRVYLVGGFLLLVGALIGSLATKKSGSIIPTTSQVQSGFAVPSKLEIVLQDLDNNGEKETLLKYDGKSYLLLYNGNMPKIVPYEIKPAEIVQKENKLEITIQDLDNNGEQETVLKYNGRIYLLLRDGKMPKVALSEEKPAEIAPKE